MSTPVLMYSITPPGGEEFEAAILDHANRLMVVSTRNGSWQIESLIKIADLFMPEQELNDFDVREIKPRDISFDVNVG